MKILSHSDIHTTVLGRECDRCRYRVQMRDNPHGGRTAVSAGAELARFIAFDVDFRHSVQRADLCSQCADLLLEALRPFLGHMRTVAVVDPKTGQRSIEYRAIDAETGLAFGVSSLMDEPH